MRTRYIVDLGVNAWNIKDAGEVIHNSVDQHHPEYITACTIRGRSLWLPFSSLVSLAVL
jgi:hypothetical protein